jgi:hypothetical protein
MQPATVHQGAVPAKLKAFDDEIVTRQRIPRVCAHPGSSQLGNRELYRDGRSDIAVAALRAYCRRLAHLVVEVGYRLPYPEGKCGHNEAYGADDGY